MNKNIFVIKTYLIYSTFKMLQTYKIICKIQFKIFYWKNVFTKYIQNVNELEYKQKIC